MNISLLKASARHTDIANKHKSGSKKCLGGSYRRKKISFKLTKLGKWGNEGNSVAKHRQFSPNETTRPHSAKIGAHI